MKQKKSSYSMEEIRRTSPRWFVNSSNNNLHLNYGLMLLMVTQWTFTFLRQSSKKKWKIRWLILSAEMGSQRHSEKRYLNTFRNWFQDCQATAQWKMWWSAYNPNIILKELKQWPEIKAGNANSYMKFQHFLIKFKNIDHLHSWNVLNTSGNICMLLSNFSGFIRDTRSRKLLSIQRKGSKEQGKTDLIQFLKDKAVIMTVPVS